MQQELYRSNEFNQVQHLIDNAAYISRKHLQNLVLRDHWKDARLIRRSFEKVNSVPHMCEMLMYQSQSLGKGSYIGFILALSLSILASYKWRKHIYMDMSHVYRSEEAHIAVNKSLDADKELVTLSFMHFQPKN